jgi:DNA-binding transcriptional ArsR family regulator
MTEEQVGAVFAALADPTRRQVVQSLSSGSTVTASRLALELPMTRQAVAKHLAALDHAGLVASERRGRETHYRLTPAPLTEAASWMASVGAQWDGRLEALRTHLARR